MTEEKTELPTLHFWMARSTYAMILTAVSTLALAFNIDLLGQFGTSEGQILAAIDAILPIASAFWLWLERRNPSFKIGL